MSIEQFLHMDGYGFYIWTSYGLSFLIFILLIWSTRAKYKMLTEKLKRRFRLESIEQQNQEYTTEVEENETTT